MAPNKTVEDAIAQNNVVIFSKSWCQYSKKAKKLISEQPLEGKSVKIFELDEMEDGDEIQSYLLSKTNQRTVPNVFINQQHVGGSDDLHAAFRSGKLTELLATA